MTFSGCGGDLFPLDIIELPIVFPHPRGNIKILAEFVVMESVKSNSLILGDDFLSLSDFTISHGKEKIFTIDNNQDEKFGIPKERIILAIQQEVAQHQSPTIGCKSDERFKEEMNGAAIGPQLSTDQKITIEKLIKIYHNEFGLGKINKHPGSINLTVNKPYPPILKKKPYPASPRNRVEIEKNLDELLKMKVIRK
ncbi:hypothetical protein CROQUDRAFT_98497 [Cronartium quercuum f. sp. fusiforme G11]|uniref:Uncharacterized protein n=1 Tax=Cronartium quercuum f. sp. fusiforme G11 TaxID=708437 RepID=A0A9P6N8R2_9BASI|nr:hypothetical protein CROQUDRAFT_98497 [Cronartium quercuum f. sp. fusiforme G11]